MKLNKKILGAGAGLVSVVLCIALMFTQCNGNGNGETVPPSTAATTLPTVTTTAPTEQTTAPTAETTQPTTEPTTVPTEPVTEPTDATQSTQPTDQTQPVHGTFVPGKTMGGSMGSNSGTTDSESKPTEPTEPEINIAAPGTPSNAYAEVVSQIPDEVTTVAIPTGSPISYHFFHADGKVLVIEDPDAYFVSNGQNVDLVDGVAVLELSGDPAFLQIGSKASSEKAFTVKILEAFGTEGNPHAVKDISEFIAFVEAGNTNGCFYSWIADGNGTLRLWPAAITPEGASCDIILTNGETSVSLSENGIVDEATGIAGVELDVLEGDSITAQVIAAPLVGSTEAVQVTVNGSLSDTLGTKDNPIEVHENPVITEEIPAGGELYYSIYGVSGMILTIEDPDAYVTYNGVTYGADDSGVVKVPLADGAPYIPVTLAVGNGGDSAQTYTVSFTYPVGSFSNPEMIEALEDFSVSLEEGDTDGYHFTWTAEEEGTLSVWVNSVDPESTQYDVMLSSTGSYSNPLLSESEDGTVTMDVVSGDVVTVKVEILPDENWNVPAANISLGGMFTAPAGSKDNPIWLTESENVVIVPAGKTQYYQGYFGGKDMAVSSEPGFAVIYGEETLADTDGVISTGVADEGRVPVAFAIVNGDADREYTVRFTSALGEQDNPEDIFVGDHKANITEGDTNGYFYRFQSLSNGLLTLTVRKDSGWQYFINNTTSGTYGDTHYSDDEEVIRAETVKVSEGDILLINVSTYDPDAPWSAPAGEVPFTLSFLSGQGTQEEPFTLIDLKNQVSVPAGKTLYYQGFFSGMEMTVRGDAGFSVLYDGKTLSGESGKVSTMVNAVGRAPVVFGITGGSSDAVYNVEFVYPLGSMENPESLSIGTHTAKFPQAGAVDGYTYRFTSMNSGVLTVRMEDAQGWQYVVNNMTSYIYGDNHNSSDEPAVPVEKIRVNEGDEIIININTFDPADPWNAPAGEVHFSMSFLAGTGTESDPYVLPETENTVTVPAGETVYYQGFFGGMTMSVSGDPGYSVVNNGVETADTDGKVTMDMVAVGRNPVVFAIANKGEEQSYSVNFTYPLGSMENCDTVKIGEKNTASLKAGDPDGYFFQWIANDNGTLTVTVDGENSTNGWQYVVNDLTSYTYGENHTSAEEIPVTSVTIEVKKGDEIQINLNTFDPLDVWNTPAGDVVFDAEFTVAE